MGIEHAYKAVLLINRTVRLIVEELYILLHTIHTYVVTKKTVKLQLKSDIDKVN